MEFRGQVPASSSRPWPAFHIHRFARAQAPPCRPLPLVVRNSLYLFFFLLLRLFGCFETETKFKGEKWNLI